MQSRRCPIWLCLILIWPSILEAGGFHITIIGGRRNAMLTNIAKPDDLTALFHNPSGLGDLPGIRIHFFNSVTFLQNKFQLKALDPVRFPEINPVGCGETGNDPCPWPIDADGYYSKRISPESTFGILPFLGFSTDLGFIRKSLRNLVFAIASYAPNFYGGGFPNRHRPHTT